MQQDGKTSLGSEKLLAKIVNAVKGQRLLLAIAALILCLLSILFFASRPASYVAAVRDPEYLGKLQDEIVRLQAIVARLVDQTARQREESASPGQAIGHTTESAEFEEALSKGKEYLGKKNFVLAYDFLLAAARVSASDPRLFDAAMKFIEQTRDSQNEDAFALAEEMLERGDSLVRFQSPTSIESARMKLSEMRENFPTPQRKAEPESRSEQIRRLIQISADTSFPADLRSRAAERARNALDDASIESALSKSGQLGDLKLNEIKQLLKRVEESEKACITELFGSYGKTAEEWLKATRLLVEQGKKSTPEKLTGVAGKIDVAIAQGMDRLQEIAPYAKSEVAGAKELSSVLERQVGYLQRWKTWLYNQDALYTIRTAESETKAKELTIQSLAEIDERLLAPYLLRRYAEAWEKVFDSLGDENKKVEATKLKVLKSIR